MKPLPRSLLDQMIANFRTNQRELKEIDPYPVVKLFTPDAQATWLLSEFDPCEGLFFGLCDLGLGFPELGYVAQVELQELRGPLGLRVERDVHWQAKMPLSAYAKQASAAGHVIA